MSCQSNRTSRWSPGCTSLRIINILFINQSVRSDADIQGIAEITHFWRRHCSGCGGDTVMGVVSLVSCGLAIFRWRHGLVGANIVVSLSKRFSRTMNLISLRGDIGWPARSPDLTPCDFFLWGYAKAKVYTRRPGTIEQLKEAIWQELTAMTRKAMYNFRERLQQCVINNGRHLSDVTFKSI